MFVIIIVNVVKHLAQSWLCPFIQRVHTILKIRVFYGLHRPRRIWFALVFSLVKVVIILIISTVSLKTGAQTIFFTFVPPKSRAPTVNLGKLRNANWMPISGLYTLTEIHLLILIAAIDNVDIMSSQKIDKRTLTTLTLSKYGT